jgi:tetratricopeptide (TPR) repeat protein
VSCLALLDLKRNDLSLVSHQSDRKGLESDSPAAAQIVRTCAFLAPEPVPTAWFTRAAGQLPAPLNAAAADQLALGQSLARISDQALARIDQQGLLMHRLTQAIIRTRLSPGEAVAVRAQAATLLTASRPGDHNLPSTWPGWARLLPHLLALDPDASNDVLSGLTAGAVWYQIRCGAAGSAHDLARRQYQHRLDLNGPDAPPTLSAAAALAAVLQTMGRHADARVMYEDSFNRRRRALGENHPDTLIAAGNLASCLREVGEHQTARELDEDTLARRRQILGEDHPHTLTNASNLASDLHALGDYQAARELYEDTLTRRRRLLGEDHPDALTSAGNLATTVRALGDYQAARELDEDTLARRRQILGEDHPNALRTAGNLATTLRALGDYQAARELDEDTLARRRRVLGKDHPDTLRSADNLAIDLRALGDDEAARELDEDTLTHRQASNLMVRDVHRDTVMFAPNRTVDVPPARGLGWFWDTIRRFWLWTTAKNPTRP